MGGNSSKETLKSSKHAQMVESEVGENDPALGL